MRLLFTIPHYYHPHAAAEVDAASRAASLDIEGDAASRAASLDIEGQCRHGARAGDPGPRIEALTACLTALHQLYQRTPCFLDHAQRLARPAQTLAPGTLDVVICTTSGRHLLERLPIAPHSFTHRPTEAEPLLLGFECHTVLRERLGAYDYYCYLEDDLILHDPWLFFKLAWFNRHVGDDKLLQPNRFEASLNHLVPKLYVDGDLPAYCTAPFQDVQDSGPLSGEVMGVRVAFARTLNPHAGCFFLSARQMEQWAEQPYFFDRESRFIGPLETSASLGIMRTFKVYRPVPPTADFLEIQHFGAGYLQQLYRPDGSGSDGP